jgi:UDP-N-acetylglucosamine transferase subunit ALG13
VILVLVGLHPAGFERLVRTADQLAACLPEEVVIQKGSTAYEPRDAASFAYASEEKIEQLATEARVIITHAAAGSILLAARLEKALVLVPRQKRYGEALDDHQLQLAAALAGQYSIPVVCEVSAENLLESIWQASQQKRILRGGAELARALHQQLLDWEQAK